MKVFFEKLKDIKAGFGELSLSAKIVIGTLVAVVLSALGLNLSVVSFLVGLL